MTTIHTGNTTTTGFSVTSDVTGRLVVKTGGSGGTTALTVGEDQRVTFANQPVVPVPVFSVVLTNSQTGVAGSTDARVNFDTVEYDSNSFWDATNYRYKPEIPGYYQFNGVLRFELTGGLSTILRVSLYKNGSVVVSSYSQSNTSIFNNSHVPISHLIYCDGVDDYVEMIGWLSVGTTTARAFGGSNSTVGGSALSGFLVRAT